MKRKAWVSAFVLLLLLAGVHVAEAGYCGAASYNCCPTSACAPCGDLCQAKNCCTTCYKTVQEVVWDRCEKVCCQTVYDQVCEQVPVCCTRTCYAATRSWSAPTSRLESKTRSFFVASCLWRCCVRVNSTVRLARCSKWSSRSSHPSSASALPASSHDADDAPHLIENSP